MLFYEESEKISKLKQSIHQKENLIKKIELENKIDYKKRLLKIKEAELKPIMKKL